MSGEQTHRSLEKGVEEEVDTDIPVVEPEVPKEETDKILDDIDALLEENAVDFVNNFVQHNGE